jgi:hypothetical protein
METPNRTRAAAGNASMTANANVIPSFFMSLPPYAVLDAAARTNISPPAFLIGPQGLF